MKRPSISADELDKLGLLLRDDGQAAEAFIDSIAAADAESLPHGAGSTLVHVRRYGEDLGQGTDDASTQSRLLRLLEVAGVAPKLRALQQLHAVNPTLEARDAVPPDWEFVDQVAPVDPTAEALACVRLMRAPGVAPSMRWIPVIAQQQLSALLVRFPAMLHPRIIWDVSVNTMSRKKAGTLGEVMSLSSHLGLPAEEDGVSAAEVAAFAAHPVLALAISAASPGARVGDPAHALLTTLSREPNKRMKFAASLLRVDRQRVVAGQPALFTDTNARRAMSPWLQRIFGDAWLAVDGKRQPVIAGSALHAEQTALLRELSASPSGLAASLAPALASSVGRILDPTQPVLGAQDAGIESPERVAPARLVKYLDALVAVGAAPTRQAAARVALTILASSPAPNDDDLQVLAGTTVECARELLLQLEAAGVDRTQSGSLIDASAERLPAWRAAAHMLRTEQAMSVIIARAAPARGASVDPSNRRRNRAI